MIPTGMRMDGMYGMESMGLHRPIWPGSSKSAAYPMEVVDIAMSIGRFYLVHLI